MIKTLTNAPEAETGNHKFLAAQNGNLPRKFGNKRDVAGMTAMSVRWVDSQIAKGMPGMKFGKRRWRCDLEEVAEWLRQQYHVQRRAA